MILIASTHRFYLQYLNVTLEDMPMALTQPLTADSQTHGQRGAATKQPFCQLSEGIKAPTPVVTGRKNGFSSRPLRFIDERLASAASVISLQTQNRRRLDVGA